MKKRAMARAVLLLVVAICFPACKEFNPAYCGAHPSDPRCGADAAVDAELPDAACIDNTGCASTPNTPVCDTTVIPSTCVLCTATSHERCTGTTPVCSAAHSCVACQVAADCPLSGVCVSPGACALEADIAYVDEGGTNNTTCSKAQPCTKLASALATPRPYIKIHGEIEDDVVFGRSVTVLADSGAKLIGATAGVAVVQVTGASVVEINDLEITESEADDEPGIATSGTSELTLKHVTVSKNKGNGITCAGKSLVISGSTITDNKLVGLTSTGCSVTASASTFRNNEGGGISLSFAAFDLTNNFIHHNGRFDSSVGGVSIPYNAVTTGSRFEFNTVVDNHTRDSGLLAAGVLCDVLLTAANNIVSHNDLNGNTTKTNANVLPTGLCTFATSSILLDLTTLKFTDPSNEPYDYHLTTGSVAIDSGTTPSTVTTDFDGQPRTTATADQGADELRAAP